MPRCVLLGTIFVHSIWGGGLQDDPVLLRYVTFRLIYLLGFVLIQILFVEGRGLDVMCFDLRRDKRGWIVHSIESSIQEGDVMSTFGNEFKCKHMNQGEHGQPKPKPRSTSKFNFKQI